MLSLIKIKYNIHQCEDTDRVYAIVRTSLWPATHVVLAGDLLPSGTMSVTPAVHVTITVYEYDTIRTGPLAHAF